MKFGDILDPAVEMVRVFRDVQVGGKLLRRGERLELPLREARQLVDRRDAGYSTRLEVVKPVGPIGVGNVEPGIGSIIETSSWVARILESRGLAKPAKAIAGPLIDTFGMEGRVKVRIAAPTKPPEGRVGFYTPGTYVPELFRYAANGEEHEVSETQARRLVDARLATLCEGQAWSAASKS
jgi:hypothetical protein